LTLLVACHLACDDRAAVITRSTFVGLHLTSHVMSQLSKCSSSSWFNYNVLAVRKDQWIAGNICRL